VSPVPENVQPLPHGQARDRPTRAGLALPVGLPHLQVQQFEGHRLLAGVGGRRDGGRPLFHPLDERLVLAHPLLQRRQRPPHFLRRGTDLGAVAGGKAVDEGAPLRGHQRAGRVPAVGEVAHAVGDVGDVLQLLDQVAEQPQRRAGGQVPEGVADVVPLVVAPVPGAQPHDPKDRLALAPPARGGGLADGRSRVAAQAETAGGVDELVEEPEAPVPAPHVFGGGAPEVGLGVRHPAEVKGRALGDLGERALAPRLELLG
jgi:hypothetical protein